ncbi:MAG TPA: RdgB/HAM1 family non-canonical purine NTP pyrophosphatase [Beijerinckiaceae bacterium]|nr:RdgB/HAM1 family non-canonical purine NTP pyrophosphatase [Beijerinckiaceae bacterium]
MAAAPSLRRLGGRVVIATHNAGKLVEMIDLLAPHGVDVVSAGQLGLAEPAETGTMFSENAGVKARAAAAATGIVAIADDSGICVDALDGAPGIFTADWAGEPRDYGRGMARIAAELSRRGLTPTGQQAHFVSSVVVAWPDGSEAVFEGRVFGTLAFPPRGSNGFGYDPIFVADGESRTFGELLPEEKKRHSHRSRAFAAMIAALVT